MPATKLRLLQCFTCKTLEELPYYEGDPRYDVVLQHLDRKHNGNDPDVARRHARALHVAEKRVWDDRVAKREIVKRMWESTSGFKPSYYDTKNTLQDDAMACWKQHQRDPECSDYKSDSKLLGNPARDERASLARELRDDSLTATRVKVWLCQFCPVHSVVLQKAREKAGLYA